VRFYQAVFGCDRKTTRIKVVYGLRSPNWKGRDHSTTCNNAVLIAAICLSICTLSHVCASLGRQPFGPPYGRSHSGAERLSRYFMPRRTALSYLSSRSTEPQACPLRILAPVRLCQSSNEIAQRSDGSVPSLPMKRLPCQTAAEQQTRLQPAVLPRPARFDESNSVLIKLACGMLG